MEPSPSPGRKKPLGVSRWRDVDALLAGDLLEIAPMAMREVAVKAVVSTDCAGIVLGDDGAASGHPVVCATFGTGGTIETAR